MDERELDGQWWLPDREEEKVGGNLSFTNADGILLKLLGSFFEFNNSRRDCPIILGVSGNGKQITLVDCAAAGSSVSFPGYASEKYAPLTMLVGGHFEHPEQVSFHRLDVQYDNLAAWANVTGFSYGHPIGEPGEREYRFSYKTLPDKIARTSRGEVRLTHSLQYGGGLFTELRAEQQSKFRIDAGRGLRLAEWDRGFVMPLQNMLTLGSRDAGRISQLTGYSGAILDDFNGKQHERPIEIVHQQTPKDTRQRRHHASEMLFSLSDIRDGFEDTISTWLKVAEELDSVCDLYFSIRHTPRMYTEQRFLNMAYAAESYHRRRFQNEILAKSEHRIRLKRILEGHSRGDRVWLKEKLAWSNERSLADRLNELTSTRIELMKPLVGDVKDFVKEVVRTRNFYTHYGQHQRQRVAKGSRLYMLAEAVGILVQSCFLSEMDIEPVRQYELFQRSGDYRWIAENLRATAANA